METGDSVGAPSIMHMGSGRGRSIEHCTDAETGENWGEFFERVYCLTFDGEKLCRCAKWVDAEKYFFF